MTSAQKWMVVAVVVVVLLSSSGVAYMGGAFTNGKRYAPNSDEAKQLLRYAAATAGLPQSWADLDSTHKILANESGGWVGRPNYTFGPVSKLQNADQWPTVWARLRAGEVWTDSTATGLGQLLTSNVKKHYPAGLQGIGDPVNEAVGFLRYIRERYGDPDTAWSVYGKIGDYVNSRTGKTQHKGFKQGY